MSDQENVNPGNLVPAGRLDLAPLAPANPLVSRGIADLTKMQNMPTTAPNAKSSTEQLLTDFRKLSTVLNTRMNRLKQLESLIRSRKPFDLKPEDFPKPPER